MFYSFASQDERKKSGGSDFLEIQFCRMPREAGVEEIVAVACIEDWRDDSLYIRGDDADEFLEEYGGIFDCGIYNNLKTGTVDPFGINYYRPELVEGILARLLEIKPVDYQKLAQWLNQAKAYNGFYILGE